MCFPHVEQIAQLHRHIGAHSPETVYQITSRSPELLTAPQWLRASREYWGVEGALHQRLDASTGEDQCRVRDPNAVWVLGIFRRLAISVFAEWRSRQPKPKHLTMPHFHMVMAAEHAAPGMRFITSKHPTLKARS
jgi:predicted transposase YbfD/YdcC